MARARNIKPGLYKNEELAECSVWARLIFPGLWMLADREGRLEDRPKRIKGELLAYDSVEVDPLLEELSARGFIVRYTVEGSRFIQIVKFLEHQTPHLREQASVIPAPPKAEQSTTKAVLSTDLGSVEPSPRSPDSLIPSSLIPSIPLPPSEGDESPEKQLFGRGLQILTTRGVTEKNARSFVGLMRKKVGDVKALTLLLMADEQDISMPLPWLTKVMDNKEQNREYKSQRDKLAETGNALTGRGNDARTVEGTATRVD